MEKQWQAFRPGNRMMTAAGKTLINHCADAKTRMFQYSGKHESLASTLKHWMLFLEGLTPVPAELSQCLTSNCFQLSRHRRLSPDTCTTSHLPHGAAKSGVTAAQSEAPVTWLTWLTPDHQPNSFYYHKSNTSESNDTVMSLW